MMILDTWKSIVTQEAIYIRKMQATVLQELQVIKVSLKALASITFNHSDFLSLKKKIPLNRNVVDKISEDLI